MEINTNYSSVPNVAEESIFGDESQDADQLRIDFLKMLTAQLEYQDPMDPVENTEFTAQMAQFSSLGEQQKGNALLEQLISAQNGNQLNQVVSYIGKSVVFEGDKTIAQDGAATTRFKMEEEGDVEISLYNDNNQFVTSAVGHFGKGDQSFQFSDAALADGNYKFTVAVQDGSGGSIVAKTYEAGEVTGVVNSDSGVELEVNGRTLSFTDIRRVEQQTS
jgi:flagellar basal-body rod modification protein FlgD